MACRNQRPQSELIRVAKTLGVAGALTVFSPHSSLAAKGRSAYICPTQECIEGALKEYKKRAPLGHALRTPLDPAVVAKIRGILLP